MLRSVKRLKGKSVTEERIKPNLLTAPRSHSLKVRSTLDIGLNGTGLSIWDEVTWGELCKPLAVVTFYSRTGVWEERAHHIANQVIETLCRYHVTVIESYQEYPQFMYGSAKAVASNIEGDVIKLSFTCGIVSSRLRMAGIPNTNVPVSEWAAQLPKNVRNKRIERMLPGIEAECRLTTTHAWDSVGVGLFKKGYKVTG